MTQQGNGRVGGQVDRITRREIREWFGDGVGRTLDEMTYAVADKIPNEIAARAVLDMPRVASLSLTERLHKGKRKLLQGCFSDMIRAGFARKFREGRRELWAVEDRPRRLKSTDRLPDTVYDAPANTESGITRPMVYQLITDNSTITEDKMLARLEKCWKVDNVLAIYNHELRRNAHRSDRNSAGSRIKSDELLVKAKTYCLNIIIRDLMHRKQVRKVISYRVF